MVISTLLCAALAATSADAPFVSAGFLKFPDEVNLGAMSAVAVDGKDRIFVLHRGEPPIVRFDKSGNFERAFGRDLFKVAHGLRVDRAGNIWTTDNGNHVLRKFSADGELQATFGTEGKGAGGKEGFRAPDDLVFDDAGNIFVADSGNARIVKLSPAGEYLGQWGRKGKGPGEFATAHGLAIDRENRVYVADRGNKRIQVFGPAGDHVADWDGFGNPFGLLVVGDQLLASEGDIHKIFHLNREGKIVAEWGDKQMLQLPHLMAVDSAGRLFVAEVNGKRVQIFQPK